MAVPARIHTTADKRGAPPPVDAPGTTCDAVIVSLDDRLRGRDGATLGQPTGSAEPTGAAAAPTVRARADEYPEPFGGRLLVTDLGVAFLVANEARYRILERMFGIPREHANLATVVAALLLADAARNQAHHLLKDASGPTRADAVIAVAVLDELARAIRGPAAQQTPMLTTLVGVALLGALARPALRGVRQFARRRRASFNRRYGRPTGRPRATGVTA